jgi:hypothetical protein
VEEFMTLLQSEEGEYILRLITLRQSRLTRLLEFNASHIAREDGWAILATAEHHIRQQAPEALELLRTHHNIRTLRMFAVETRLFDIAEETTAKGGIRVLYRMKANTTVEIAYMPQEIPPITGSTESCNAS